MNARVLLLRGINVGGNSRLPMDSLNEILRLLGVRNVTTYIQSGNAVFTGVIDARVFGELVEDEIETRHGFRPRAMVMTRDTFNEVLADYPFPDDFTAPKTGHIWFFAGTPHPDREAIERIASGSERYAITDRAFYLHAPLGFGRSELTSKVEGLLGTPTTARNLNTCLAIADLLSRLDD